MDGVTFSPESGYAKGNWAREAGTRAARFPGDAVARANVYAEFQRQIVQVTGGGGSDWVAMAERGADGSYIFRGNPRIAEPKVFVIDPQGNCHAGNAKEALEGSGPGKRVNYSKLRQIGVKAPPPGGGGGGGGVGGGKPGVTEPAVKPTTGGAGEPAVTPKTAEPPTTGPKVEPVGGGKPTTSGGARIGGGGSAAEGKGPRISIRGVGGFVITLAVFWWLGSRAEKAEAASLDKLMADKVEPKIQEAFKAKSAEAERINTQSPENKLHANITVDFDYQWDAMGIGGTPSREHVYDARFVSLELGWKKKSTTTIIRHDKRTSVLGSDTYHDATRRVTWSVELDFGETDKQLGKYRAHQKMAADFARRGKSAREAAESQHFDRGPDRPLSRKDMENQKWGLPTEADLLEMRDRELFVTAYIEYVAFYGPDEQYLPAIAYLRELEAARTTPNPSSRFSSGPLRSSRLARCLPGHVEGRDVGRGAEAGPAAGAALRRGDRAVAGDHGPDRRDGAQRDGGRRADRPRGAARVPDRHDRRAVRVVRLRAADAVLQLRRLGVRARRRDARPARRLLRGLRADGDLHAVHDRVGRGGRAVRPDVPRRHRRRQRRLADPRARRDGVHRDLRVRRHPGGDAHAARAWRASR